MTFVIVERGPVLSTYVYEARLPEAQARQQEQGALFLKPKALNKKAVRK